MKAIGIILFSLVLLPGPSAQTSGPIISSPLNGVYEGKAEVDGKTKFRRIYMYRTNTFYIKTSSSSTGSICDFIIQEETYEGKKATGKSKTVHYAGKLSSSGSRYYLKGQIMIGYRSFRSTREYSSISKVNEETLLIDNDKFKKTYGISRAYGLSKISKTLIEGNLAKNTLSLGYIRPYTPRTWGPKKEIGVLVYMDMQNLDQQLDQTTLRAQYKVFDNINEKGSANYQFLSQRVERLLGRIFPGRGQIMDSQWLTHFRNLSSLEIYHPESGTKDFVIQIQRNEGLLTYKVINTGQMYTREIASRKEYTQAISDEKQKKLMAEQRRIQNQSRGGINPSGQVLDIAYSPTDESNPYAKLGIIPNVGEMTLNIYYGKFSEVNRLYFKGFHNVFIHESSVLNGRSVSDSPDVITLTNGKEIHMHPKFTEKFKQYLKAEQIRDSGLFRKFLVKYPPSSIVYRQFCENLYRYSKDLPPASKRSDISF